MYKKPTFSLFSWFDVCAINKTLFVKSLSTTKPSFDLQPPLHVLSLRRLLHSPAGPTCCNSTLRRTVPRISALVSEARRVEWTFVDVISIISAPEASGRANSGSGTIGLDTPRPTTAPTTKRGDGASIEGAANGNLRELFAAIDTAGGLNDVRITVHDASTAATGAVPVVAPKEEAGKGRRGRGWRLR